MGDDMHRIRVAANPRRHCPALFLDRDGTILEDPGYLSDPDKARLFPGAAEALRRFADAGHAIVVVTNQSGVGRGLFGWKDYEQVAARVRQELGKHGVTIDVECACGHAPEEGASCGWRKPAPGMIDAAARRLDLDLGASLMVGDMPSDLQAAEAAGVGRAVHVLTGHGARQREHLRDWCLSIPLDLVDDLSALQP